MVDILPICRPSTGSTSDYGGARSGAVTTCGAPPAGPPSDALPFPEHACKWPVSLPRTVSNGRSPSPGQSAICSTPLMIRRCSQDLVQESGPWNTAEGVAFRHPPVRRHLEAELSQCRAVDRTKDGVIDLGRTAQPRQQPQEQQTQRCLMPRYSPCAITTAWQGVRPQCPL